jgi:hypothetical protein
MKTLQQLMKSSTLEKCSFRIKMLRMKLNLSGMPIGINVLAIGRKLSIMLEK